MIVEKLYLLRWRFDFAGKPTVYGVWNDTTEGRASSVNKEGLVRASIESKSLDTLEIKTMAECDGHEFLNFQWISLFVQSLGVHQSYRHEIAGMKLLTTTMVAEVLFNGNVRAVPNLQPNLQFSWMRV